MNRRRVGGKEDICLPECPDVCYILPVTSLVNNIILSWPLPVKVAYTVKAPVIFHLFKMILDVL